MNLSESSIREHAIEYLVRSGIRQQDIHKEFAIKIGSKNTRADIVVFEPTKSHEVDNINIIIECKAATGSPDNDAVEQLKSYLYATSAEKGYVVRQIQGEAKLQWTIIELDKMSRKRKFKQGHSFLSEIQHSTSNEPVYYSQDERYFTASQKTKPPFEWSLNNLLHIVLYIPVKLLDYLFKIITFVGIALFFLLYFIFSNPFGGVILLMCASGILCIYVLLEPLGVWQPVVDMWDFVGSVTNIFGQIFFCSIMPALIFCIITIIGQQRYFRG